MNLLSTAVAGAIAGLALAAPLGAIGALLVQEGITRGLRRGIPGAAGVATADAVYCTAAVAAGALVGPLVSSWMPWPQIVGGSALLAVGARGLARSSRTGGLDREPPARHPGDASRRYVLFLSLTALNPATLVYFAAILTGLGHVTESAATAIAFVGGVGVASFGWQALLVAIGALLGTRTGPSFRRWTAAVGNGLVVALGAALVVRAPW